MPRRRQGHFHVVRRANSISKTRSTIYNEEGKLSQPEVISNDEGIRSKDGDSKMPKSKSKGSSKASKEFIWKVDENLTVPDQEKFCYLHKKFKKMEASSEGDELTMADQSIKENGRNVYGGEPPPSSKQANFSLEALFQVTGHELEKINSSSQDSDSSERLPLDVRHKRQNKDSEVPGKKKIKTSEEQFEGPTHADFESQKEILPEDDGFGEEREAAKRLKLGRHVCPYCGLGCGKPSVLQKHIRAHTNERPYPCVPCGFAFKTKSNLYKHCKSRAHHLKVCNEVDAGNKIDNEQSELMERFKIASGDPGVEVDIIETEESSISDGNLEEDDEDEGESTEERQNLAPGRARETLPPAQQTSIKEDSPIVCALNSPTSSTVSLSTSAAAEEASTPLIPTSIYKPKFHSVPYSAPAPRFTVGTVLMPSHADSPVLAQAACSPSHGVDCVPFLNASLQKTMAYHDSKTSVPSVVESKLSLGVSVPTSPTENCAATVISLAKRRNDQFQLRLEIPHPRSFVGGLLGSSSSSSSSSSSPSISSIPTSMTSSAICDRLPNSIVTSSSSMLSTSLPCRPSIGYLGDSPVTSSPVLKSPKLTSPEYLQQHISKLISQNAAIVETLDPLWPRRYTRQSSIASSHNVDAELRSKERLRRYSEDVARPPLPPKSKLALALLASPSTPSFTSGKPSVAHLLPETKEHSSCTLKPSCPTIVHQPRANATPLPENSVTKDPRKSAPESDGGSLVRILLLADQPKQSPNEKSRKAKTDIHHPQNPEGSIIKDLLLKTRAVSKQGQNSSCMRLSGGSISSSTLDKYSGSTVLPSKDLPSSADHREKVSVSEPPYSCASCHISYRSAENLEVHRNLYCSSTGPKVSTSATSGGSFTLPTSPLEMRLEDSTGNLGVGYQESRNSGTVQDSTSTSTVLSHKPRGRPRGSKNRPKVDILPNAGVVNRNASRIHSKSVSEFVGETLEVHDITLDALKGKLNYRRNSVSGEVSDSVTVSSLTRNNFSTGMVKCNDEKSDDDGPILKKHLLSGVLGGDRSPPLKKRKIAEEFVTAVASPTKNSENCGNSKRDSTVLSLKSLEQLSKYPMKASAVHLFGGEVQICDGAETKKFVIDSKIQSAAPGSVLGELRNSDSTTSAVVATIAKPVHNSGGTVLQVQDSKMSLNKPVCIPVVSIGRPLMATGSGNVLTSMSGSIILPPVATTSAQPFTIDISHLKLLNPNPILVNSPSLNSILPPVLIPFPSEPSHSLETNVSKIGTGGKKDALISSYSNVKRSVSKDLVPQCASQVAKLPLIAVHSPKSPMSSNLRDEDVTIGRSSETATATTTTTTLSKTFLSPPRPTTLALKNVHTSSVGMTLVSPETPRPEKKYGQCYHNGQYYTYLEFKQSTRVYYCNCHPQPMYVPQSVDPKLSMYSMWQTVPAVPDPFGLTPPQAMGLYISKPRNAAYSVAKPSKTPLVVTHSSYWTFQQRDKTDATASKEDADARKVDEKGEFIEEDEEIEAYSMQDDDDAEDDEREALRASREAVDEESEDYGRLFAPGVKLKDDSPLAYRLKEALEIGGHEPRRVKIFEGGFKSNEDYTYVRGRGRGKYVCEECGIRCKKPSMLKKHIRTHTDVRPYTCKHCNFSFKTKGNLTKHMKSKAHHKKCVELGIVPVPVTIDDAQIDEEALARQERIEHQRKQFADVDEDSALEEDEEDDDDDDDEEEEEELEGYKEGENEDDESMELEGQFEDASELPLVKCQTVEGIFRKGYPEQEIARSLLELGKPDVAVGLSSSPLLLGDVRPTSEGLSHNRMIICDSSKRDMTNDEREELIGNPRVVWSSQLQSEPGFHRARMYGIPYVEISDQNQENLAKLNSEDRLALVDRLADEQNGSCQSSFVSLRDNVITRDVEDPLYTQRPLLQPRNACSAEATDDEADQPIDLSMPHPRPDEQRWDEEEDIIVDDDEEDEAEPIYYSYPAYEEARPTKEREINGCSPQAYETISPAGSSDCPRDVMIRVNPLPTLLHSPYGEEGSEEDNGGHDEIENNRTFPKGSVLQSYFCELSPVKKANAEKGNEATSNSNFPVKDSSQLQGPSTPFSHAPRFGYPPSPPSQLEGLPEPSLQKLPADRIVRLPPVTIHNMPLYIHRSMDDGKCICTICNKAFSKPSQLRLHVNIHYFERPFRCDSCAISFRTKGHLQKHKRSVSHYNKVNMNMTFGTPTTDNPRPFKCDDCKIAFRIHGHLAKHLRSKMHIMKLECLGKLPFGTYAEIERSGANLNEIDTTDCENSLESLQVMAHRLVDKVASSSTPCWSRERTISGGSCDDHSDGVPYIESPLPMLVTNSLASGAPVVPGLYGGRTPSVDGCASPDLTDASHMVAWNRKSVEGNVALSPESEDTAAAVPSNVKREPKAGSELPYCPTTLPSGMIAVDGGVGSELVKKSRSAVPLVQEYEDISDEEESRVGSQPAPKIGCISTCRICGKTLKSAKFLQLHMYVDHAENGAAPESVSREVAVSTSTSAPNHSNNNSKRRRISSSLGTISNAVVDMEYGCKICGEIYPTGHLLKQHMMTHAKLRPYVCEVCDAGFTDPHFLKVHCLQSHGKETTFECQECSQMFGMVEELERHLNLAHPGLVSDRVR